MTRRQFIRVCALAAPGLWLPAVRRGGIRMTTSPVEVSSRAIDIVFGSPVIDMLSLLTFDWERLWRWQREPDRLGDADRRQLRSSGIDVFHPAIKTGGDSPYESALHWFAGWNRLLTSKPCVLERVDSIDALMHGSARGPIGVIAGLQDSAHFRTAADVEMFFGQGQRISQLTYNERNRIGSGCYVGRDRGLSEFGGEVVSAMNRVGMAIDVSHCGERERNPSCGAIRSAPRLVPRSRPD